MRMLRIVFGAFLALVAVAGQASAQFGKNQVVWEKVTWNYYQSAHFDFYFSLDIRDDDVLAHFADLQAHLEGSYGYVSANLQYELKKRPIVVVTRTHSQFEALHIGGDPFIPEGVGAYALPRGSRLLPDADLILVVKPDFLPTLNRTIYTHELVHIFQFDMVGWSFIRRAMQGPEDAWLYEAVADYVADLYAPYSRDDIRRIQQRVAAANAKNPDTGLPTLEMLKVGAANPYSLGAMVFQFLESRYGRPEVMRLIVRIFNDKNLGFQALLEDVSKGEFATAEAFDRAHRDYWASLYAADALARPKPHQETSSYAGRQVLKRQYPYPLTSPVTAPDGTMVAFMTMSRKNGIVLAVAPALGRDEPAYVPHAERKRSGRLSRFIAGPQPPLKILTTFMPPKHYEYLIAQQQDVWPFNGWDLDWWQEPQWVIKVREADHLVADTRSALDAAQATPPQHQEGADRQTEFSGRRNAIKALQAAVDDASAALAELRKAEKVSIIGFFGRKGRDHALFLLDVNTGEFIAEMELPVDQAFSPVFSPDGRTVYLSAAWNIRRDLYALDLDRGKLTNLTNGGVFNSAPAVSPDGTRLAYVAFDSGFQKLFMLDLATGVREQLTRGRWNDNSPSWSPDGTRLVFTSDEKDRIWNLYTLDLATSTVRQYTEFFGGAFTPRFVRGEDDRLVFSAFVEDDQFHSFVYPNFELFDARLKEPLRAYAVQDVDATQSMALAFRLDEAVPPGLDQRQLDHPLDPPARWKLYGSGVSVGTSTYFGTFGYSRIVLQDILADRTFQGLFAQSGYLRFIEGSYTNTSHRWGWTAGATHYRFPLRYELYSFTGRQPEYPPPNEARTRQVLVNNVWVQETSLTFAAVYPLDKFNRVEIGVRPRMRDYLLPFELPADMTDEQRALIPPIDLQAHDFFSRSGNQANVSLTGAYVHDTVLYSYDTMGPLHGQALRFQLDYGPPLNKRSEAFVTGSADVRKYLRVSNATVLAGRVAGMYSNRPSGDLMFLGGNDTLRSYPYLSIAGNQAAYASGELRFPLADVVLFGAVPFRLRGSFFGDAAVARFSQDRFPAQQEWSYGIGLHAWLMLPLNFEWARTRFAPNDWKFTYRIGYSF